MRARTLTSFGRALSKALYVVALASVLALGAFVVSALYKSPPTMPLGVVALAMLSYLASHLLRIARLALLSGDAGLSLRALAKVHLFTSSVSLVTPFKLGELYRVLELSLLTRSPMRGLILVWLERVLDVVVILALLVLASVIQPAAVASYLGVLVVSLTFVLATLFFLVLMPDNLRRVGSYVIRRYDQGWTVGLLWLIAELRGMTGKMSQMLRGRRLSLLVFTIMIWTFEGLSFGLLLSEADGLLRPVSGLLSFLSLTIEGQTLATLIQNRGGGVPEALVGYVLATQGALLVVGIIAGLAMARTRLTRSETHKS
jgi:hypothetical protein